MDQKYLYLDFSAGVAGDMLLGTFLGLGASEKKLRNLPKNIGLNVKLEIWNEKTGVEEGKRVKVIEKEKKERTFSDIKKLLKDSSIGEQVRKKSLKVFMNLAEVEAKIHDNENIENVHFHEIGASDSIIDIVGCFSLLEDIEPVKIFSSKINMGRGGFINTRHGKVTNPAPATLKLLENIPTYSTIEGEETVTPTGAALTKQIVQEFDKYPVMKIKKIGRGKGKKDLSVPNLVKGILGEPTTTTEEKQIMRIETNIDDCNPEILGNTMEKLFNAGALDVCQIPANMKKNRSGIELIILCDSKKLPKIEKILFEETTTFGYRYNLMKKREIDRKIIKVNTKYGKTKVKVGTYQNKKTISPEYDNCKKIAKEKKVSLKEVYQEAKKQAIKKIKNKK